MLAKKGPYGSFIWKISSSVDQKKEILINGYSRTNYRQTNKIQGSIIDLCANYYQNLPYTLNDIKTASPLFCTEPESQHKTYWTLHLNPHRDGKKDVSLYIISK